MRLEFIAEKETENIKLGLFLRRQGLSASLIKSIKFLENGILVNGKQARTNTVIQKGDCVCLNLPPETMILEAEEIPFHILYESENAVVFNKPAGQVVHPTLSYKSGTMGNGFSYLMQQRGTPTAFRPVGRLDRNTSGIVLCAMNAYSAPLLSKNSEKIYLAAVQGKCKQMAGVIEMPLAPCEDSIIKQCVCSEGKKSVTEYRVLASTQVASLVEVKPITGRTHQIRAHFASIGHPLFGDDLYGGECNLIQRHALHCAQLNFIEPFSHEPISVKCPLPEDIKILLKKLDLPI